MKSETFEPNEEVKITRPIFTPWGVVETGGSVVYLASENNGDCKIMTINPKTFMPYTLVVEESMLEKVSNLDRSKPLIRWANNCQGTAIVFGDQFVVPITDMRIAFNQSIDLSSAIDSAFSGSEAETVREYLCPILNVPVDAGKTPEILATIDMIGGIDDRLQGINSICILAQNDYQEKTARYWIYGRAVSELKSLLLGEE